MVPASGVVTARPPPRTLYASRSLLLILSLYNIGSSTSFLQTSSSTSLSFQRISNGSIQEHCSSLVSVRKASSSSDADNSNSNNDDDDISSKSTDSDWMKKLLARQLELDRQTNELTRHWRKADCKSGVSLVLPNWVRRLDVDYPLTACGSASETIYIANLETGEVLASSDNEFQDDEFVDKEEELDDDSTPENLEQTLRLLYGAYDGGGTIAIAISGTLICQSKRKGGVELWRLDPTAPEQKRLISQGSMRALEGVLVTCLHIDEDNLWVATADGRIQAYPLDGELPLALTSKPDLEWKVGTTIVSMSICAQVGCGVVSTSAGNIQLFSLEQDGDTLASFYPPFDSMQRRSSNVHALCATIVSHTKNSKHGSFSIACGGNDGSLFVQPLQMLADGEVDIANAFPNFPRPMGPRHLAPLKCIASPAPGLLVSGGQDGTVRVWDIEAGKCLYQFVGYKVWLGSLWTDGVRLVTDGADNTVILHNFDHPAKAE
jgi:WD40 repeat protein